MLYTSESRSLCTTEIAVHTPLGNIPKDYYLATIEFPDIADIFEIKNSDLPTDWKAFPYSIATQSIGDKFLSEGKYLILKVPSAVVQGDFNYLLNPSHRLFSKVNIIRTEAFEFEVKFQAYH